MARYRCRNARVPAQPGWYQVELPCTGMLTPGWMLAALVLGAGAVDVVLCSDGGCPFGNDAKTRTMLRDVQQIADHLGIRLDQPVDSTRIATLDGPLLAAGSTARAASSLAARGGSASPLSLATADVGQVTIDPAVCTACERCALVCPSEAITSRHPEGCIELSFDPTRCTACAGCLTVCPEVDGGAISVRRELDLDDLASGPRLVRRETVTACEICGEPVAPTAMLAKIGAMLGEDAERTMSVIGRRCQRCRGR